MARYKTFVATGMVPDGRLYAGDLNAIQDFAASASDFTSTVDVGTLRVGDPTLQLFKYGAGEFRMTGAMRFDGILRGLSGIVAGAFTTAQRDAIPPGSRPYGLLILNTTTNEYQWNSGTDAVPVWGVPGGGQPGPHHATHAPGASDAIDYTLVNMRGLRSAKPAASSLNSGLFYFETDWGALWRSNGTVWEKVAQSGTAVKVTLAQFATLSPADGDTVFLEVVAGTLWHLRYNSGSSGPKWEFLGGPGITAKSDSTLTTSSSTYGGGSPAISIPRAGEYDVHFGCVIGGNTPNQDNHGRMSFSGPGVSASDAIAFFATLMHGQIHAIGGSKVERVTFSGAGTVGGQYRTEFSDPIDFRNRYISVIPRRIS